MTISCLSLLSTCISVRYFRLFSISVPCSSNRFCLFSHLSSYFSSTYLWLFGLIHLHLHPQFLDVASFIYLAS
ncbi:hypothetical protein BDW67DRAFT_88364 [Aspergillus spinulosporus]